MKLSRLLKEPPGLTFRRLIFYTYQYFLAKNKDGVDVKDLSKVLVYPRLTTREEISSFLNKVRWALPVDHPFEISFLVSKNLLPLKSEDLPLPKNQRVYHLAGLRVKFLSLLSGADMKHYDLILLHNYKSLLKLFFRRELSKTRITDKNFLTITEGKFWQEGYYDLLSDAEKEGYLARSTANFEKFMGVHGGKEKAVCFLTGPSIDRFAEFAYPTDILKIICNSNVRNNELLEHIHGPDAIVFADPVFHFSPAEYAATFRDTLMDVVRRYKPFVFVPLPTVPLLLAHHPELKDSLVGIPMKECGFNFPDPDRFWVKANNNILTMLMLPVASAIAKEIYIIGADGRQPDEKYFWKFSPSSQFDSLLDSVRDVHPSFFRDRNYADYYLRHCRELENQIIFGENLGKRYFSLTESYIPVLNRKHKNQINDELKRED